VIAFALLATMLNGGPPGEFGQAPPSAQSTAAMQELAWDQRLDNPVPLDLAFRDENGATVQLRDLAASKPIVLVLAYYRCPQLCNLVLNGLLDGLRGMAFKPGEEFEIVVVSFDARETPEIARAKRNSYVEGYARPGTEKHWHFLTGDEPEIAKLAEAVGFRYRYDANHDRFDHASGITVLTPDGRVSRYLFGIRFEPRDLRLAIVEASAGNVGSVVDQFLLFCFHYDPATGKYNFAIFLAMRVAAAMTVAILGLWMWKGWKKAPRSPLTQGANVAVTLRVTEPHAEREEYIVESGVRE
jgi:protein SCO1/2